MKFHEENKIVVIRPKASLNIANLEKNQDKIKEIYEIGYKDGLEFVDKIKEFIKGNRENEKSN